MAGRGHKKLSFKFSENKKWFLGGYARRSFDDGETDESYTIINQRSLLDSHSQELSNVEIVDYYIDDGYTGTNFNRPGFKRLMQDAINGRINGIVVKDLSRLGRNYKEVGKYIEEIFPIYNIRLIAVNDKIDSFENPESVKGLDIPVKNLMNEGYSRDTSKKVKSAYMTMAKKGMFVAGTTPYGYKLDPKDKHHLVIDEKEAEIIRKIFQMTLEGAGRIKICKYLNNNGILCRKEIQRRKKRNLPMDPFEIESMHYWGTTTIGRILTNETYIGNLVQLKTKRACFGSNKLIPKNEEEWVRGENMHEAIISKETFAKVQEIIKKNIKEHSLPKNLSIFRGVLKCADCHRAMTRQDDYRGNRCISNYFCMGYLHIGNSCKPHKIKTKQLEESVLKAIHLQVKLVIELEKSLSKLCLKNNKTLAESEYKNNVKIAEIKISDLREEKKKTYEDWKFNKIDKNQFVNTSSEIEKNINQLKEKIELYTSTYIENVKRIRKNDYWIGHYKRNKSIKKITKKVIDELIDVIYVNENGDLDIKFKYQDEYLNLVNYLKEEEEKANEKMVTSNVWKTIC